jgi:hypothetical protein
MFEKVMERIKGGSEHFEDRRLPVSTQFEAVLERLKAEWHQEMIGTITAREEACLEIQTQVYSAQQRLRDEREAFEADKDGWIRTQERKLAERNEEQLSDLRDKLMDEYAEKLEKSLDRRAQAAEQQALAAQHCLFRLLAAIFGDRNQWVPLKMISEGEWDLHEINRALALFGKRIEVKEIGNEYVVAKPSADPRDLRRATHARITHAPAVEPLTAVRSGPHGNDPVRGAFVRAG